MGFPPKALTELSPPRLRTHPIPAMTDPRSFVPTVDDSQGTQGSSQYRRSSFPSVTDLVVLDDQWDQIFKQDSNARYMRTKSWPLWNDWKIIFGKDRANGGTSEGAGQAVKNSSPDEPITSIGESSDYHPSFEDFLGYEQVQATFGNGVVDDSSAQSGQNANANLQVPKNIKRKRKCSEDDTGLIELQGKLHAETNDHLDTLSARIGYKMDLGKARQEIFRHLGNIPELTET
ncbi:hypothetical protein AAHA92_21465 [Salvia divinorum]|uniref:No apical meristem-associated C-terminal domain-containing protein n=1 Tax=Salvia divinorum TaxID=28513 RepID=A0ABD1GNK0_SALDI